MVHLTEQFDFAVDGSSDSAIECPPKVHLKVHPMMYLAIYIKMHKKVFFLYEIDNAVLTPPKGTHEGAPNDAPEGAIKVALKGALEVALELHL